MSGELEESWSKPFIMSSDTVVPEKSENFPIPGVSNSTLQKLTSFLGSPVMGREPLKGENRQEAGGQRGWQEGSSGAMKQAPDSGWGNG